MKKTFSIEWLSEPEGQDYPAAISYLSLIYNTDKATKFAQELQKSPIVTFKSKDIFRASSLSLLVEDNYHVKKNIKKIEEGTKLSPILLIRDSINGKVVIADGYHRLCAVYRFDEDALIPCKIYWCLKYKKMNVKWIAEVFFKGYSLF